MPGEARLMYTPRRIRVRPFFSPRTAAFSSPWVLLDARDAARYACCPSMTPMLTLTTPSDSAAIATPPFTVPRPHAERSPFIFVGERLWLDFVNCEHGIRRFDALRDFETLGRWLEAAVVLDAERAGGIRRRAQQQPAGAAA